VLDRRLIGVCTQQASGFLEDGLQLWHALVQAAPTAAPDALWDLFPAACALLALQGESEFRLVVDVLQSYLLLEPRPAIVEVRLTRMGSPSSHAAPLLMHLRRWGGGTGPGGGAGRAAGRGVCAAAVGPQNDRGRLGRCGAAQCPVPLRRNDGVNDMHGTGVCVCVCLCVCVCAWGVGGGVRAWSLVSGLVAAALPPGRAAGAGAPAATHHGRGGQFRRRRRRPGKAKRRAPALVRGA
jgi:hypothetical protein